jgi:hypothetical protein
MGIEKMLPRAIPTSHFLISEKLTNNEPNPTFRAVIHQSDSSPTRNANIMLFSGLMANWGNIGMYIGFIPCILLVQRKVMSHSREIVSLRI